MNLYLYFKLIHILAAFWFVTGIVGRQTVRRLARQSEDIRQFRSLTQAAGRFESLMVIPGNFLVIAFGLLVAWTGGWPIFGFLQGARSNWLLITNILLLAGILVVPLVYAPRGKAFDRALQQALDAGEMTPELISALDDPAVRWAHRGEYLGLLIIIVLMVLKPF